MDSAGTYRVGSLPGIEHEIAVGATVVGEFAVLTWTKQIAFCRAPLFLPRDVAVQGGLRGRGGALPGDIVAVRLFDVKAWKEKISSDGNDRSSPHVPVLGTRTGAPAALPGCEIRRVAFRNEPVVSCPPTAVNRLCSVLQVRRPDWPQGRQPQGEVVAVLERHYRRLHACRVQNAPASIDPRAWYQLKPYDEKYPILAVSGKDFPTNFRDQPGSFLFLVEVVVSGENNAPTWVNNNTYPAAKIVRSLGRAGTAVAESRAIVSSFELPSESFSEEAEACIPRYLAIPDADELKRTKRRDLRESEFIVTIDPATARDLDDALSCAKTKNGFRIGVHIADVSHFVPAHSALDYEAQSRATSTYLVERVIPMLPPRLSEEYCSLNPGKDRFAFSVIWNMSPSGEILAEWFGQTLIRSRCRLTYEEAQALLQHGGVGAPLNFGAALPPNESAQLATKVAATVQNLFGVASYLRQGRWDRGALSLNRAKLKFAFEDMNSLVAPRGFALDRGYEANWLVEEFMLMANCRVARKLVEFLPDRSLLRKHDRPDWRKVQRFVETAQNHGFDVDASNSRRLNESLQRYANDPCSDVLRAMATYSLMLAQYVNSVEEEQRSVAHYALAVPVYTHFTSPIRRYADLVVHRQLLLALEVESLLHRGKVVDVEKLRHADYYLTGGEVSLIAENCNAMKMVAREASKASARMYFCLYLEALRLRSQSDPSVPPTQRCIAFVTKIIDKCFQLYAPEIAIEVEIYHGSAAQLWVGENEYRRDEDLLRINWGGGYVEEVRLFHEFWVTLTVIRRGKLDLDMIVIPPSERVGEPPRIRPWL